MMKKLLTICLMLMWVWSTAQNLTKITVEILEDGAVIDIQEFTSFTAAATIDETISLNTSGLSAGIYSFAVYVTDENGLRSIHASGSFLQEEVITAANLEEMEYFVDTDPGTGSGTSIAVAPSSELSFVQTIDLSALSPGFHTVYLRGKDETGKWGSYASQTVYVEESVAVGDVVQIEELEYFVDSDPGAGLGTSISVTLGSDIAITETLSVAGLSAGFHTLYLRGKLENGTWGPYSSKTVYVEPSVGLGDVVIIEELEYFVDSDPGPGMGSPISITASSEVAITENLTLSGLAAGFHTVYLRGKLQGGSWGPSSATTVYVEESVGQGDIVVIDALEFFVDTDPGAGLGTPITVTSASEIISSEILATSALESGFHTLYLRGKLQGGSWGPYTSQTIYVEEGLQGIQDQIIALEYFFDSDPGPGNATEISTTLPAAAINELVSIGTSSLSPGAHTVSVRAKDESGAWGHYLTTEFEVDAAAASVLVVDPNGGETLTVGGTYDITWTDIGIPGTDLIEIRYSSDGGSTYGILADGTFDTYSGSYTWTVPDNEGSDNLIQVANTTQAVADESDAVFTIEVLEASILVTTPNGGETLTVGDSYEITWTEENISGTDLIEIRYSSDGGSTFGIIADGTFATYSGSYSWTVPDNVGVNNLIEIANTTQLVADESDASFEIAATPVPAVTVISPNGGESLQVGDAYGITWLAENISGSDLIEVRLSTDGGSSYSILADGVFSAFNGSYSWTIPDLVGSNNLIQVANTTLGIDDVSDAVFDIVPNYDPPVALPASDLTPSSFTAGWTDRGAVAYYLDIATDADFENILEGFDDLNVGTALSQEISGLLFRQSYFYRVRADFGSELSANSNVVSVKTLIDSGTQADSIALRQIYSSLGGGSWDPNVNWATDRFRDWEHVTFNVSGDRVQSVDLSGVGAAGEMPHPFTGGAINGLNEMTAMDLSNNAISQLIDFSDIIGIDELNVSGNNLEFDDLEPLIGISDLQYSNQASIQFDGFDGEPVKIFHLEDPSLSILSGGTANSYTWYRNDIEISSGAEFSVTGSTLEILDIDYNNMGAFRAEITSGLIPGLTIDVGPQVLLAIADIEVEVTDFDAALLSSNLSAYLLSVTESGGYDTLVDGRLENVSSQFTFHDIVLGDYLLAIDPNDQESYIAGYYGDTFLWEEADVLQLREDSEVLVKITAVPDPLGPEDGDGNLDVLIEEDFGNDGGRVDARRRAARRKCGLRRKRSGGRTGQDDDEFELIAYGETDDNGEFKFGFLPQGTYRFFVEYPGIPLTDDAAVEFEVGEAGISDTDFRLEAFASEDGIEITIEAVLGIILDYFKDLEIYPNPSSEYLNISYRHLKSHDVTAQLVDLSGNTVWSTDLRNGYNGEIKIDVSNYEQGMYILRFYDREKPGENVVSFRVIVKK